MISAEPAPLDESRWRQAVELLAVRGSSLQRFCDSLPFSAADTTAGSETELHAVVVGRKEHVDFPLSIEASNYYANVLKRASAEDTPKRAIRSLKRFLDDNSEQVWDHSWVRFPRRVLSAFAQSVFDHDTLAVKSDSASGPRSDLDRFAFEAPSTAALGCAASEQYLRLPVSYLIKLALADVLGSNTTSNGEPAPHVLNDTGRRLMEHFLNDNISPETFSFHVLPLRPERGLGRSLAVEAAQRYLFTQLLVMYANDRFELQSSGQQAIVCMCPHPPVRQKLLNECISDSFYRELFTSPCLSGWDCGEAKHDYMLLCHQVLSRSQLHAVGKVRDAGLIAGNLVKLPSVSNISLANNGIHVSLGSRKLTSLLEDPASGFGPAEEKAVGDLVTKVVEHFLPLFVGTYSAAPYRLDFTDFHAERVLGFMPHQLDYTHLRMMWRRWKKKARNKIFGQPVSPSGFESFDSVLRFVFRLKGDFVPDYRLLDYLVAPMSTDQSPALDGRLGNSDRLKRDLTALGIFDDRMSLYSLYRQRTYASMGFCGFEGRHYSLCESLERDLGQAADLQVLVTALAFKLIAERRVTHADIPDDPSVESERRQIFFGVAAGLPTFFVKTKTPNRFLREILSRVQKTRASHRYPGYTRVYQGEYRRALVELLRAEAAPLIECLQLRDTVADLVQRVRDPERHSAAGRLTRAICDQLGVRTAWQVPADEFNRAAERFYRTELRRRHLQEGFRLLADDWRRLPDAGLTLRVPGTGLGRRDPHKFLDSVEADVLADRASQGDLRTLVNLMLLNEHGHASRDADVLSREVSEPLLGMA